MKNNDILKGILLILSAMAAVTVINPSWIYSPIGFVDGWVYLGHFLDPVAFWRTHPSHAAGDLLPHILPAAVLYQLLPPHLANASFKLITYFGAALFLFLTAKREAGLKGACFATVCFLFYRYFLMAAGTDYMDGRVVLYFSGALYCLSKSMEEGDGNIVWMYCAGIFSSLSVFTSLLAAAYLPLLGIFYGGKMIHRRRLPSWKTIAAFAGGAVSMAVLLSGIYWFYTGRVFFFGNSIRKAAGFLDMIKGNPFFPLKDLHWAALSIYMLVWGCAALVMNWKELRANALIFNVMNAAGLFTAWYLQYFKMQETMTNSSYFGFFMPVVFLTLAVNVSPFCEKLTKPNFRVLLACLFVLSALTFIADTKLCEPNDYFRGYLCIPALAAWACVCAAACGLRRQLPLAHVCACFFVAANFSPANSFMLYEKLGVSPYMSSREQAFDYALGWSKLARQADPDKSAYLWYNSAGGRDFFNDWAGVSHIWPGSVFNTLLPDTNAPITGAGVKQVGVLHERDMILLVSGKEEADMAAVSLSRRGISLSCGLMAQLPLNVRAFYAYKCHAAPGQ